MSNDFKYYKLTPFKWFILENFPFIEADFDALTNYELFCKLGKEINKIIDAMNLSGEQVEALTDLVNNFFDTLDVQEEINNKLDEMTQDGTLAEIINQDIFTELNNKINKNTNDIAEISRRKFLLVGDSYLTGWTPEGTYTNWGEFFQRRTGFECDIEAQGGVGFANGNLLFYNIINAITTLDYTDVIIMGGHNDVNASFTDIVIGMQNVVNLIRTKFTKLKNIYIGMCANNTNTQFVNKLNSVLSAYVHGAKETNCHYLNGIEFALNNTSYFSSDGKHPNQNGQYSIALNLINAIYSGYANFLVSYSGINVTLTDDFTGGAFENFGGYTNNNITQISKQGFTSLACNNLQLNANMRDELKLGDINSVLMLRGNYDNCTIQGVSCIVENGTNNFYDCQAVLLIKDGSLYLKLLKISDNNSNYVTFNEIKGLQISPFNATFITNTI